MNIPGARSPTLAASLLRPRTIGNLFGEDRVAHRDDLMDQAPMQTLAMGGQLALAGRLAPPGRQGALAVLPGEAPPARLLDAPTLVVVVRVVGPSGALAGGWHGHREPARRTTRARRGVPSRGTMAIVEGREVQANGVAAYHVFGFVIRHES